MDKKNISYALNSDCVFSHKSEEQIILNIETGVYYKSNETASFVLKQISQNQSFYSILQSCVNEYSVKNEEIEKQLYALLQHLEKIKIITRI